MTTAVQPISGLSLVSRLRRRAREETGRTVLTFLDGDGAEVESLTWAELDARARGVAAGLERAGAVGERVLLLHPPGLGFVTSFLGCLYAGAVAVPVYPPGRNRAPGRLRAIAADCGARVVLAPSDQVSRAGALATQVPELAGARFLAAEDLERGPGGGDGLATPAADAPAFLQYTSGSTAEPKGVVVLHRNLLHNEEAIRGAFAMSEDSVVVGWLPLYHDMGLIGTVLQPLYTGARAVLMSPLSFLARPAAWLEAISRYRATTSGGPSFAYELCAHKVTAEEKAGLDLSSWEVAFNGAEPVRAGTIERFVAAFAPCGFRRRAFLPCYGLAEATLFVTGAAPGQGAAVRSVAAAALERHRVVEDPGGRALVSSGRPAPETTVTIVDPESGAPVGNGRVGEIWIAGPGVAAGYWDRAEESAQTFGARLADGRGPYLRTGDLGFLAGGELYVTGRLKDLVILRGRNHYPQDLERTAEASHPALEPGGGAAFSIERGGEERLVIVHEVRRAAGDDLAAVAGAVRSALAGEHEVAVEEIVLLRAGTLPRTSSGKVRRAACRAAYEGGGLRVVFRTGVEAAPPEPAEGPADGLLAAAARALRREAREIDPEAPLVSQGLDSLAAAELRAAALALGGEAVPLADLLAGMSLRQLEAAAGEGTRAAAGPAGPDTPGEHPLSPGQRALWFLDRLDPAAAALHLAGAARVRGGLDAAALGRSLARLTARHPALRTTFEVRDGEPLRRVHAGLAPDYAAGAVAEADLPRRLAAEAYRPFDLERAAPLRVRVWRLPSGEAVLLLAVHHLAADFAALAVLLSELAALYREETGGEPALLPPLAGPGTTAWIRQREGALVGPRGEHLLAYWRRRLAGDLPALDLPVDRPRPAERSWRGTVRATRLAGAGAAFRALARERGVTLYAALLAGFQAVLQRWTGEDEALVGAPVSAGPPGEVGYFVNLVPLRLGLDGRGHEPFAGLVARAGAAAVEAFEHGEVPFSHLARELALDRDAGRSPVRALFVLQPGRTPEERALAPFALGEEGGRVELAGLALESLALPEGRAQVELTLMAAEVEGGGLALSLTLEADLFDPATADRLLSHLCNFLQAAAADPQAPAVALEILAPAERLQLAAWSAGPPLPEPDEACLHERIAEQAARIPEATALTYAGGALTYGELTGRARRLAEILRGLGVGPEVRVGVCAGRSPEMVAGLLAVLEAGGAYVPLDPAYPAERLAYLVEDSGAVLVLTDEKGEGRLPAVTVPLLRLDRVGDRGLPSTVHGRSPTPQNLAYLIYTSGTTGRPKAVAIEHRNALALVDGCRDFFRDRELDGVLAATSIGFDISVFELWATLARGGRVVLADSALDLPEIAPAAGVRLVDTVPSAYAELLAAGAFPPGIETANVAGETLRRELVEALFAAGVGRVVNLYGPSEDTTFSTFADLAPGFEGEPPIGRPVGGGVARVLDAGMRLAPLGVAGELFLTGAGLSRGYLGRPDLTAARFVPDPFPQDGPGARLYRTGDRARRRADGELLFLGRLDHQVKIRGFRIEPGEIEAALLAHPEVAAAAVLPRGQGDGRRLVAFVAPAVPPGLRAWLAARLPEPLVPSGFVPLATLPLLPNGKLDRGALAALEPGAGLSEAFEAPRTPLEAALASLLAEVLEQERIGVHEDFFALGGHSLLALKVQARVRERLGADPPLSALFRAPTVAGLARLVAAAPPWRVPPPVAHPRDGAPLPLSFAQERMWLLHRLDPAWPGYHVPTEIRLAGPLAPAALAGALDGLACRHEALRTRFPETGGGPVQEVEPAGFVELPRVDLGALPRAAAAGEAERLAGEEARRPFDLATAPPWRSILLRLGSDDHRLLLNLHHIAADETSLEILARELAASYGALAEGRRALPAMPALQIADVAVWQRGRLCGDLLEARLAWWEERLAGLAPPGEREYGRCGGTVSAILPPALAGDLATLARGAGATLYMVLLAGFQAFLSRLSGALDLAVGSPVSIRDHPDLEGVVGPLLNTLVLRTDLSGEPDFRTLLGRVRASTLAAHERADLPFELLVERLQPQRGAGANPLFEVIFAWQRAPAPRQMGGLTWTPRPLTTGTAKVDLTLFAAEREGGIGLELEYAADRWEPASASRLLDGLTALLAAAAAAPGRRLPDLAPLLEAERLALAVEAEAASASRPAAGGAPQTPTEELLAGLWEDLLGIERPGLHDDFFDLGGQSLLAARVVSRVRRLLGVELPLRALFEERTIAGLAARVEEARGTGTLPEPPLAAVPSAAFPAGLPLSFGQERLWFMDRLAPESPVYNMAAAVSLDGALEPAALAASLAGVTARHGVLRSAFPAPGGVPVQVPLPAPPALPRVDLSALAAPAAHAEALRLAEAEALRPFGLAAGPPLRATLLILGDERHRLLVTVHHIAFDGWSLGLFLGELAALYAAALAGKPPALSEIPLQYGDFAVWQRGRLSDEALAPHLAWWRENLAGAPPLLALPLDRPRPPVQGFRGGGRRVSLPAAPLRALARRLEATPFMTLIAAWAALLARFVYPEGEDDLVVGTAVAGRGRLELEPLIGLFAENLVLRLDLTGDPAFATLAARAREATLAAWAHQDVPFERLVRELRQEGGLGAAPLYQTALTLDASDRPPPALPGVELALLPHESRTAKLDLALYLEDRGETISGFLEYDRDLFDAPTAARLRASFERLVEALPQVAEEPLSRLPVLGEAEEHQVLRELPGGERGPEVPVLVPRLIERWAAVTPDAPAVSGGSLTLSYGELDRRAGRLAQRLRALGVGLEVRVAVLLPRVPELAVALLGIWKSGGVYVPLDPTHPEERLAWLLEDSRAAVMLASRRGPAPPPGAAGVVYVEEALAPVPSPETGEGDSVGPGWPGTKMHPEGVPEGSRGSQRSGDPRWEVEKNPHPGGAPDSRDESAGLAPLRGAEDWGDCDPGVSAALRPPATLFHRSAVGLHRVAEALGRERRTVARGGNPGRGGEGSPPPESAAYLIYTSGSTGRPKGVVVPHAALAAYAAGVVGLYGIGPGDRVLQVASPAFDLSLDEILPCLTGGAELVLADDSLLASAAAFLAGCGLRGITVLVLATAFLHELAARVEAQDLELPPGLRLVSAGGERLLPGRLASWLRRFPARPFLNTYGPTETTIQVTAVDLSAPGRAARPELPVGRPLPGAGVWLLDARAGRLEPVPRGVVGEVGVGGRLLARGYHGRPDATALRFAPHPFARVPGERLYRTGDLGRFLPDGSLELAGRIDGQVKVRGYRVEPGEVEARLASHPGVEAAAVVARKGAEGALRLVGYVVPHTPAPAAGELRAFLAETLFEPMIPAELVFLDALPLTPHGKVDRRALPAPGERPPRERPTPRGDTELAVAAIWREVLEVDRVGADDNFFDLGGHSLALARVHVLLRERLGAEIPIVDLFRHPTVAALARRLAPPEIWHPSGVQEMGGGPPGVSAALRPPATVFHRSAVGSGAGPAARPGRFLEARRRMAAAGSAGTAGFQPAEEEEAGKMPALPAAAALHSCLSRADAAFRRFAAAHPEALERASFAALEHHGAGSPYPLQPWPALVGRARVAEMARVSNGLAGLIKSLPRRVFADDPERLREFYDLPGADLARLLVRQPDGLAEAIGRGDFLDTAGGLKCLEFNMLSALGGWEAPLWAEAYRQVPVISRFLVEERLEVACRDTVALLLAHAVAQARELGKAGGEINVALVTPSEAAGAHGHHLEAWLAGRYAAALAREAPGATGAALVLPYSAVAERGGCLWAGERRLHAAVELHEEGTAAPALRSFRAGNLKLFNAPVRALLTDKRNLALLSELGDRDGGGILTAAERELVAGHVPWTRRLRAAAALRQGREVWLPELALSAREDLVIKRARAGRGAAVHLGVATPAAEWRERVESALAQGDWVVQERVEPLPYVYQHGERGWAVHDVVWGLFALGGSYGGAFLSLAPRAGREAGGVINVMRGATVGVVFEVENHG